MVAGTILQPWNSGLLRSLEEEQWQCDYTYKKSRQRSIDFLWKEHFRDPSHSRSPSWVNEEPRRRESVQDRKLFDSNEKVMHDHAILCDSEITSFVALLKA
eukprot:c37572_g1_i1 orf=149-451(+)